MFDMFIFLAIRSSPQPPPHGPPLVPTQQVVLINPRGVHSPHCPPPGQQAFVFLAKRRGWGWGVVIPSSVFTFFSRFFVIQTIEVLSLHRNGA